MPTTIQKWGNSLGIRIPRGLAEQVKMREGTQVDLDAANGVLRIRPSRRRRHTLAKLLARAKGPSPFRRLDSDGPRGRELL